MVFCAAVFFFCNDTATTEIYTYCHTLSLHDALPISSDQYDVMTRMAHDLGIVGCFPRDVPGPMGGQDRVEMEGLRGLDAGQAVAVHDFPGAGRFVPDEGIGDGQGDRKSTRLNSSH